MGGQSGNIMGGLQMGAGLGLSTIGGSPELGIPMMTSGMGQMGKGQGGPTPPPPPPSPPRPGGTAAPPTGAPPLGQPSVPQVPGNQQLQQQAGAMSNNPAGQAAMNPQQLQQLLKMMGGTQ